MSRIRGQHTTMNVLFDDVPQRGSFAKCERVRIRPDNAFEKTAFVGETEADYTVSHSGFEVEVTIHKQDDKAQAYYQDLTERLALGQAPASVKVQFITKYIDPATPTRTVTYGPAVGKVDEEEISGQKEFQKDTFSFRAPRRKVT